ncbi:DUF3768 domain-containing protein [Methylobacterium sp. WL19]|uniref:DUF3768 domain-containing protein n=1 Tax=Methylobacterium sp. WL19 TaxID=2603896 RepID=UPI001FEF2C0B|nr:DUF3768 domain-containing protein [Methylobacterium sp. WL19]
MSRPAPISVEADPASTTHTNRVRPINDAFRRSFAGGHVMLSRGIASLPEEQRREAEATVQAFEAFSVADDPYNEHDFGAFDLAGPRCFWKIDTYDRSMVGHSTNPADPAAGAVPASIGAAPSGPVLAQPLAQPQRDVIAEIEGLAQLRANGSLSEAEFEVMKAQALSQARGA